MRSNQLPSGELFRRHEGHGLAGFVALPGDVLDTGTMSVEALHSFLRGFSVPAYDSGRDVLASRVLFTRPALFFGKPDRVSISTLPNDGFRPARRFDITLRQRPRLSTSEPHAPTRHRGGFRFSGKHRRISKRAPFRASAEYSSTSRQALSD
jgi:hypothetical protein